MTIQNVLREMESHQFAIKLGVVSGLRPLLAAAASEPSVITLKEEIESSGSAYEEVLNEIRDLAALEPDQRYENPNDTALAILLWMTSLTIPDFTMMAATLVDQAPQCWYAKKLARALLVPPQIATAHPRELDLRGKTTQFVVSGDSSFDYETTLNPVVGKSGRFYKTGSVTFATPGQP